MMTSHDGIRKRGTQPWYYTARLIQLINKITKVIKDDFYQNFIPLLAFEPDLGQRTSEHIKIAIMTFPAIVGVFIKRNKE